MLPINSVQQSIFQVLGAALAPVPVVDDAGESRAYPYVSIGEVIGEHADTLGEMGVDLEITIHVWSRQLGMQECADLMEAAKDALHRQSFPLADAQWVSTIFVQAQTMRDADGRTRHGILRFRVLTFEVTST